ncbi:hypothetical protein POPTR_T124303v4 [Populus trichocarpa]|uniref:Uncharacterized protein n=1 Tax=Populus trichocarpa TaxID=3694 RepID=A0ACC0RI27_POPTR|nr:uncharacterized protein LOC112323313 isoform X4 [Populus trichocarpa]KAI9215438.1 hypothetical protein POPTR_T124303v4 [Populus trichocarpa]
MGFGIATGQELRQPYFDFAPLDSIEFWICYYTQCHLHSDRRDCKYQISFEGCHRRNISRKSPFKTALFVGRYIIVSPLDWSGFWICYSSRCYINSERFGSENNTPTRNYTSRTAGLQISGEAFTRLLRSSYSRSLRRDCKRGTTTTRKSELSFYSWSFRFTPGVAF